MAGLKWVRAVKLLLAQSIPALVAWGLFCQPAGGQTFDATGLREPADLGATWLVHAGDDPAYAAPDFDDSQWMPFNSHGNIGRLFPQHPEIIWYRLKVKVSPDQKGLALKEHAISRAFEVYANGERLIASGSVAPYKPYTMTSRILRTIPDRMVDSGTVVIALRVHISPIEWADQGPGFIAQNLTLGPYQTLWRDDWLTILGENCVSWLEHLLTISLGIVALALFSAQRRQVEYLWVFAAGVQTLIEAAVPVISTFHDIPQAWQIPAIVLRVFTPYILISMYFGFVHQRIGWRWRVVLVVAGVLNAYSGVEMLYSVGPLQIQFLSNLPFILLLSAALPIVLGVHWRRGNREAGILLIPALLLSFYLYAEVGLDTMFQIPAMRNVALRGLTLIDHFPAGPFSVPVDYISGILSSLALALIMVLRSTKMSRRQALMEGEMAAAQEVQKVLLPEHRELVPGFTVDSVYEPAQQVGGDFFQIVPVADGGLLIVVGDVAGKGLPAAMLVSVLVGAISGVSDYTQDPAELLAGLNERLVGRSGGGFSTALAAHIAAGGAVSIANAGHLSPYLDGREVELPGALPLGVAAGVRYETTQFHLGPGSRLTFYSDGVVEAQNQKGELFGFERAQEISGQPAAEIARVAKRFGQEDDITVVTITRDAAVASAA